MSGPARRSLETHPVHLGLGATAVTQPEFPRDERSMAWYADYAQRHASDGAEGRLLSEFTFTEDWNGWEMHPAGDELVVCLEGAMTLHQELGDGSIESVTLKAGDYAINPRGTWHTADIAGQARALFVTAGIGTEHRPR